MLRSSVVHDGMEGVDGVEAEGVLSRKISENYGRNSKRDASQEVLYLRRLPVNSHFSEGSASGTGRKRGEKQK